MLKTTERQTMSDGQLEQSEYGSDWPEGSVIEMYGDRLRIRRNWGASGEVEALNGELECSKFYWVFQGDHARLISRPEK
jgi:hypothetical protein